jgi:hypothetical protein
MRGGLMDTGFGSSAKTLQKRAVPFVLSASLRTSNGLGERVGAAAGNSLWYGGTLGYGASTEYIENRPLK